MVIRIEQSCFLTTSIIYLNIKDKLVSTPKDKKLLEEIEKKKKLLATPGIVPPKREIGYYFNIIYFIKNTAFL